MHFFLFYSSISWSYVWYRLVLHSFHLLNINKNFNICFKRILLFTEFNITGIYYFLLYFSSLQTWLFFNRFNWEGENKFLWYGDKRCYIRSYEVMVALLNNTILDLFPIHRIVTRQQTDSLKINIK